MSDKDFLRAIRNSEYDGLKEYLDSHDINFILNLLLVNNYFQSNTFNYITSYYNQKIDVEISKKLVNKGILKLTDLPNYMYKDESYINYLFDNLYLKLEDKYKIIDKFLKYDTLNDKVIKSIIGTSEIDNNYNIEIYSNIKYTKVLATLNYRNGYHFKSSGINDEVVDILCTNGIEFNNNINCDLYKNFYFILKKLDNSNYMNVFKYVNINYNRYSDEELFKIMEVVTKKGYYNDIYFEFINHDIKFINYWLENGKSQIYYLNKISEDILKDEKNGVVKNLIDKGLYINKKTNPIILNSEIYIAYKLEKDIKDNNNLYWIKDIGTNLIDNPNNGIIYKALENGCIFFDIFFNHVEYIFKYLENDKIDNSFYEKIPKNIVSDPTNNVIITMMDKNFLVFQSKKELFNIKEYVLYFINNKAEKYNIKTVVDNCDVNFILENDIFKKCIDIGYEINDKTPKEILNNEECLYYYLDKCMINNNQYGINKIFGLISDEIINNISNGIIINIIRKGFKYSKDIDKRIINNRDYVSCFLENQEPYYNNLLLNNLNSELLNDRELINPCIENGYKYNEQTPIELYQVDYIKRYFTFYNEVNSIWLTANNIFKKIDEEVLNDSSNGLVYTAIDYGYDINSYSPSIIYNNIDYLLYYAFNNLDDINYCLRKIIDLNKDILNNDYFVYSMIDFGYNIDSLTPPEIINNYNYVMYALKCGKIKNSSSLSIPVEIIDESMALLLLMNKVLINDLNEDFYDNFSLKQLYYTVRKDVYKLDNQELKKYLNKDVIVEQIPSDILNDKINILSIILYKPNVIDIIDDNMLDSFIIRCAFINNYNIIDKNILTKYINIIGIKELIKLNTSIIEYYSENEFKELFDQDYEEIIRYTLKNGYNISKVLNDLPDNLNNKKFIMSAIENNYVDIINYANFDIDEELFLKVWTKDLNIPLLNENIKLKIINNNQLFDIVLNSNEKKLIKSISLFYPNNINNNNSDLLLDKLSKSYKISDRDLFKKNLSYLYSKNKEIFYDLNLTILTDKYLFLGIETINRIIPDSIVTFNVTRLDEYCLKIFNLCISYLYSIDLNININDILYKILSNLNTNAFYDMSKNIVKDFVNLDSLIEKINSGKTNGNHIAYLDNLINILCIPNNIYGIENVEDINNLKDKKIKYFESLNINDITDLKNGILYKYYNIDLKEAKFIYDRYCYLNNDIENIEDINLKKILYDISFLIECDDLDSLNNIYNSIPIEDVDLNYNTLIECLIRNEYVKQYNKKLSSNVLSQIDNNVYEVDDNVNLFIHVLGAYNRRYVEPINFKDEWNIELMTNHGVCTSYITNQNLSIARNVKYPTLVFTELENNSILLSSPDDIASNDMNSRFATSLERPCCFLSPDTMIDETRWHHNEVVLERKNLGNNSSVNYKRLPNYVLYMVEKEFVNDDDSINMEKVKSTDLWRMTEKASKDFGIPILIINKVKINKKEKQAIDNIKKEMISTSNYSLIKDIIIRYINNLMDNKNIITKEDLYDFIDSMINLSLSSEDGIEILKNIYQTILDENRKFNDHRTEERYNYLKKYESIIKEKIIELNSNYFDNSNFKKS